MIGKSFFALNLFISTIFANAENSFIEKVNGDFLILYLTDKKNHNKTGFTHARTNLYFNSNEYNNFSINLGIAAYTKLKEINKGNFPSSKNPILYNSTINYKKGNSSFLIGRTKINLDWIGGFHEGFFYKIEPNKNLKLTLAHSKKMALIKGKIGRDFEYLNKEKRGISIIDLSYNYANLELNPSFYYVKSLYNIYSFKALFFTTNTHTIFQYAKSVEKNKNNHGSIFHTKTTSNHLKNFKLKLGYIQAGKKEGAGSIVKLDAKIEPAERCYQIFEPNAKTFYLSSEYAINNTSLKSIYLKTNYEENKKEKEINFELSHNFNKKINLGFTFAKIYADLEKDNSKRFLTWLYYKF